MAKKQKGIQRLGIGAELIDKLPAKTPRATEDNRYLVALLDNYRWLPDGSVDLILTDPPFAISQDTNFHTYEGNTIHSYRFDADKGWDSYSPEEFIALMGQWAVEFNRVLRTGGSFAIFCADTYLSHLMDALSGAGLKPKRVLTWRKPNAVPINRKSLMMSACEYVIIGVKGAKPTFNADIKLTDVNTLAEIGSVLLADKAAAVVEQRVRDAVKALGPADLVDSQKVAQAVAAAIADSSKECVKRAKAMFVSDEENTEPYFRACVPNYASFNSKAGNRIHPTEKPVVLLRYLASLLSLPGDLILDPFAGSGSTGEAALALGRQVVLVERDKAFYKKITARLRALQK